MLSVFGQAPVRRKSVSAKDLKECQDNLKKLRKTVKDSAANKDTLETLSKLQSLTVASKSLVPGSNAISRSKLNGGNAVMASPTS